MKYMCHMFLALFAASTSFAATVNLSTLTTDYEAKNGDVLTGILEGESQPYKITIADGATVTLKNVAINGTSKLEYPWAGLTCLGNCTIVLRGSNTVKGFYESSPGIQAAKRVDDGEEYTLTIEGDGSLEASSNGIGAGIGCGYQGSCGNIVIKGGKVSATGGGNAAGIGGVLGGTIGDITISGGEVTATAELGSAGIGGGYGGTGGNITISGGKVTATGGSSAAGIGSGIGGSIGDITIRGAEVSAVGGLFSAGIGSGNEGTCGDITIANNVTKVVAAKGDAALHSIGAGKKGTVGKVSIVGEKKPVEKELFIFPAPTTLVDIEVVGSKTYAVINGDYSGDDALNIKEDVSVDRVVFERTFPNISAEDNYSTIMFPFEISIKELDNIWRILSFLGIGVDKEKRKYVAVEQLWSSYKSETESNHDDDDVKLEAYKPYLIQSVSKGDIYINNMDPLVLKKTPTKQSAFDVAQSSEYNQYGDYVFRGVVQTKTWGASDPDVLGTDGAAAYGFAATATEDVDVGQFVKVGEGAYIRPFRGYIYKKPVPKKVKSNGGDLLRQTASISDDLPDVMDIVVVDRKKDGTEQTTVIGQFNSRTGEIRMNRTKRTYDLKGRSVRDASRMAKGVYLKK